MDLDQNTVMDITVAPVTLIAQISVALIAVAVTAIYILKHLPDPDEDRSIVHQRRGDRRTHGKVESRGDSRPNGDYHADRREFAEDADNLGAGISHRESREEACRSFSSQEEYRAIILDDDYQDLCSLPEEKSSKPSRRKLSSTSQSKEWPISLESIDEEDEDGEQEGNVQLTARKENLAKPKQSPIRGSRVPKWYYSKTSSGIPSLPKVDQSESRFNKQEDINLDSQTKCDQSYIDEPRKIAITCYAGTPVGVIQRKPWPSGQQLLDRATVPDDEQATLGQSQRLDSDQANTARNVFMVKGINVFSRNPPTPDYTKSGSIPDIRIDEPNALVELARGENRHHVNKTIPKSAGGGFEWVETHASTVHLPDNHEHGIKAEIVLVDCDEDHNEFKVDQETPDLSKNRPTPRPRTNITQFKRSSPVDEPSLISDSALRMIDGASTSQEHAQCKLSNSDIDCREQTNERNSEGDALDTEQHPSNTTQWVSYKHDHCTSHLEGGVNGDVALQSGVQTLNFIEKENIDFGDNDNNTSSQSQAGVCYHQQTYATLSDGRVFRVINVTKSDLTYGNVTESNAEQDLPEDSNNSVPASFIISSRSQDSVRHPNEPGHFQQREVGLLTTLLNQGNGTSSSLSTDESKHEATITPRPESMPNDKLEKLFTAIKADVVEDRLPGSHLPPNSTKFEIVNDNHYYKHENNDLNGGVAYITGEEQTRQNELDKLRETLADNLPFKRHNDLFVVGNLPTTTDCSEFTKRQQCGSDEHSTTSPSEVIARQRARIRKSLDKLNAPGWYTSSNHYQRVLNSDQDEFSDINSELRMTRSPSSCVSDCWSVRSSGEASSLPTVTTKLAFQSEARYRRDFPKRLFNESVRNAFSCAEFPTDQRERTHDTWYIDSLNYSGVETVANTDVPAPEGDEWQHAQINNQISPFPRDVNEATLIGQPNTSPIHSVRPRSRSEGDDLYQAAYFNSLAVKRLERQKYDSIFFVTGYFGDFEDQTVLSDGNADRNSLFASESYSDGTLDDMDYNGQVCAMTRPNIYQSGQPPFLHRERNETLNHRHTTPFREINSSIYHHSIDNLSSNLEEQKPSPTHSTENNMHITSPFISSDIDGNGNWPLEMQSKCMTTPAPRLQFTEDVNKTSFFTDPSYTKIDRSYMEVELNPDLRYKTDGSRNQKISPRFPIITVDERDHQRESLESTPRASPRRATDAKVMITDTSLDSETSVIGRRSDQDQMSSSENETVVSGEGSSSTSRASLNLAKLKESQFAGVQSVITSRHMQPGNRSGMYLPGGGFVPPPQEISMEEIVDSLLGLPYQRATSAVNLSSSGYRGSSSASSPMTFSTPDLTSSGISSGGNITSVSSSDKSHSVDSLHNEGDVLNSIVFGRRRDDYQDNDGEDAIGEEDIMIKCSYKKCAKAKELCEARKTYKTCHNCYTYYCSRQCRKLHWSRHKKRCLFSRVKSACKHIIYYSRYNGQLHANLSRVARTGYLSRGRGAVLVIFPDTDSAENYTKMGFDALLCPPTYSTVRELESSDLFCDHMTFLLEMCRSYDPETKFVLNVAIMAVDEQNKSGAPRPRRTDATVKKCAKLSLVHTEAADALSAHPTPETLILTSPSSSQQVGGVLDRKARQVCFVHIQRQLRQRGVNLRHQHGDIYEKLCRWVENHEHFVPVTVYPVDERSGQRFMCVLMPDSEPDELGWANNHELLKDIDLDVELEKLENVAAMSITDL